MRVYDIDGTNSPRYISQCCFHIDEAEINLEHLIHE